MLKKLVERKKEIRNLKQNCFNARKDLIVITNEQEKEKTGCIQLSYRIDSHLAGSWIEGIDPERTYGIAGPYIRYCVSFNPKRPLRAPCTNTQCPMYEKNVR